VSLVPLDTRRAAERASRALASAALVLILCFSAARAEVVDRIVAVVGNEVITQRELEAAYQSAVRGEFGPGNLGSAQADFSKEDFLAVMIERKVIEQEVKRQGIKVDALEVERAIDRKRESLGLGEREFERALASEGITMEDYREQVKNQLVTYRLLAQEVRGEIEITDAEIEAYYNRNKDRFATGREYHVRHIYIPFPNNASIGDKRRITQKLEGIRSSIGKVEDFKRMARLHSQTPTAGQGGDLGWFTLEELMAAFRQRVEKLGPGEMSPVFEYGGGVHLVMVESTGPGRVKPLDEVKPAIREVLFQQEAMERYDIWLERLKSGVHIENRLER